MQGMDRREFLQAAAGAVAGMALRPLAIGKTRPAGVAPEQMNILFLVVEDWTTAGVGCYGNELVKTPHVDALARSGVRFDRAYCQAPICNPSRSSFCTGLRPGTTGIYGNWQWMSKLLPADAVSIAELLKRNGAFAVGMGKLYHHTHYAAKQLSAFDRLELCKPPPGYKGISKGYRQPPGTRPRRKKSWRFTPDTALDARLIKLREEQKTLEKKYPLDTPDRWQKVQRPFQQLYAELVGDLGEYEEYTQDGRIARYAARMIGEFAQAGRQFFMSVGLHAPHTPLLSPKKYSDMYDPAKMPTPAAPPEADRGVPDVARRSGRNYDIFNQFEPTGERVRAALAGYYGCSSFVDAQIGIVLDALARAGIAERTIVVMFSDHGFHLGEHGCWSKYTLFEQSTRVPLIVRLPGAPANGQVCDGIVELIDVLPTLADLWGIARPDNFEGISLRPLLADAKRPWKAAAFSTLPMGGMGRAVRTKRYRYTEWAKGKAKPFAVELYDLRSDPWEQHNLASDPAAAETVARLAKLLKDGWKAALPPSSTAPARAK